MGKARIIEKLLVSCYPPRMTLEVVDFGGYRAIKASYSSVSDKEVLGSIVEKATRLAGAVNPHAPDGTLRAVDVRTGRLIGGLLAEKAFLSYLESQAAKKGVPFEVVESTFNQEGGLAGMGFNQIDLRVRINGEEKQIEIRSSFSYKTTLDRLFGVRLRDGKGAFSIIGWYTSGNKPNEVRKDYYAFAIHHYDPSGINERINSEVEVYLAGIASRTTLESQGETTTLGQTGATFTVINPLNSVPDVVLAVDEILS